MADASREGDACGLAREYLSWWSVRESKSPFCFSSRLGYLVRPGGSTTGMQFPPQLCSFLCPLCSPFLLIVAREVGDPGDFGL
jgi:hypothetical protein